MNLSLCPPKQPVNSPSTPLLLCLPFPRCVMKMDHHCPWINNCCGHMNHAYFTSFLLLAPLGCSHAAIIFIMTMYTQLYERVSSQRTSLRHAFDGLLSPQLFLELPHSFHHVVLMLPHMSSCFLFPHCRYHLAGALWRLTWVLCVNSSPSCPSVYPPLLPHSLP